MHKTQRESRYVTVARLAYQLAQRVLPRYTHPNSPKTYTQHQLVACVLLRSYLNVGWRDLEEWLLASDRVCAVLDLTTIPDHTTLYRAFQRTPLPVWQQLHQALLSALAVEESVMIIDATSFGQSWVSHHYLSRTGRQMRDWLKGVFLVGMDSQYILAWCWARGQGGSDAQYLNRLRRRGHRYGIKVGRRREWALMGDKGFDGIQARATDLIPPRQGQHPVVRADRRLRLELTGQARLDGLYGRRVLVETVFSVMKRKSGDTLRAHRQPHQRREMALKALVYNLHR